MAQHSFLNKQQGISLSGLIVVLALIGVVAMIAMKVFPSVMEYQAIKSAIAAAKKSDESVREIQNAFDKNAEINDIKTIRGTDLVISKETGQTEIGFAYEKRIPLFGNVTLLIDYAGTTDPKGTPPQKSEPATTSP